MCQEIILNTVKLKLKQYYDFSVSSLRQFDGVKV